MSYGRLASSALNRIVPTCKIFFSSSTRAFLKKNKYPPRKLIHEDDVEEAFIKGGGRGGQKINKTNSKVQLRHKPTGIVVFCQATRSQKQNRDIARQILAQKVEDATAPAGTSRSAVIGDYKKNQARKKKHRAKKRQMLKKEAKEAEKLVSDRQAVRNDERNEEIENFLATVRLGRASYKEADAEVQRALEARKAELLKEQMVECNATQNAVEENATERENVDNFSEKQKKVESEVDAQNTECNATQKAVE